MHFYVFTGIIAIIFSTLSSSEADTGNMDKARTYGKVALGINIASVITTVIAIIIGIVYVAVFMQKVADGFVDSLNNLGCGSTPSFFTNDNC